MKNFVLFFWFVLFFCTTNSFGADSTCTKVITLSKLDDRPSLANSIYSTHFIVHWQAPVTQTFAQNASDYAEYAWQRECNDMNWPTPPADNNRGGDNRYDIYIIYNFHDRGETDNRIRLAI